MKIDFRLTALSLSLILLTACGQQKTVANVYESATDSCSGDVIPKSFVVKYKDGRMEKVSAASEQEFLDGYLSPNLDQVEFAEPDYRVHAAVQAATAITPVTFTDNWGSQRIGAAALWQQNVRGDGVIVAVIDSGMDITHPQLANQLAINPGETGTDADGRDKSTNAVDDDKNGFVDDVAGWDFTNGTSQKLMGDHQLHGTHVSGIIAAAHGDARAQGANYVEGVAPGAKLLPLAFLDESGSGSLSDGVRAISYAVSRGARVINASWGGTACSHSLRDMIASLSAHNVIFVSAAGNDAWNTDRQPEYPASLNLPAQLTIGATGNHDLMAQFSNYGVKTVHIFAPGIDIVSTVPGGLMASLSGTSMATPFVSGAVALLVGAVPTATADQVREALYNSAYKNYSYLNASQGRVDLTTALNELQRIVGNASH